MTDNNAAQAIGEAMPINYVDAEARAQLYANTVGVEAPTKLIGEDGAPARELLTFCIDMGASLDWIFLGDVRAMIHDSYKVAKGVQA